MSEVIDATYSDDTTFQVDGDLTRVFVEGRRVRADIQESDHVKSHVVGASYNGVDDVTTVDLDDDVLTSDLEWVQVGVHSTGPDGGLPLHDHSSDEQGGEIDQSGGTDETIESGIIDTRIDQDPNEDDQHVELQVSPNRDFSSPVIDVFSDDDQAGWYYHDGSKYVEMPSEGVPWGSSPTSVAYEWGSGEIDRGTRYYIQWRTYNGTDYSEWFTETKVW